MNMDFFYLKPNRINTIYKTFIPTYFFIEHPMSKEFKIIILVCFLIAGLTLSN